MLFCKRESSFMFNQDNFAEEYENLNISQQEYVKIEFDECTFTKCNLSHASFKNCIFAGCHFIDCDLSVVTVINSKFSDIRFSDCKLIGIDWTRASWDSLIKQPMKFSNSVVNSSSFYGLELDGLELHACEVRDVDFTNANLKESDLRYSDFTNSIFANTNLSKANFSYAKNFDIDIKNNILKGALFSRYEAVLLLSSLGINLID